MAKSTSPFKRKIGQEVAGEERFFVGRLGKPSFVFDKTKTRLTATTLEWLRSGSVDKEAYYHELKGVLKSMRTNKRPKECEDDIEFLGQVRKEEKPRGPVIDLTQDEPDSGDKEPERRRNQTSNTGNLLPTPPKSSSPPSRLQSSVSGGRSASCPSPSPAATTNKEANDDEPIWSREEDEALVIAQLRFGDGLNWPEVIRHVKGFSVTGLPKTEKACKLRWDIIKYRVILRDTN